MPSTPYTAFTSTYVTLPIDNIDTDQIIPARFLKTTERSGLGKQAFNDWRYDASGALRPDFPLNALSAANAQVLVAGDNFGCGSSREHAVWALLGAGFRAVVSPSFADIFRGNALGNGLLPIQVDASVIAVLNQSNAVNGARPEVSVDLERETITLPNGRAVSFKIPAFARYCMLHGVDEMDVLLEASNDVARYEESSATFISTRAAEVIA